MNRKFITGIIILGLFGSCHKTEVVSPEVSQVSNTVTLKDDHIYVLNIQTTQTSATSVNFAFSTRYEKDIASIEVFSGATQKNLCSIFEISISEDSHELKNYEAIDAIANKTVNYYMIKYTTKSGDFTYSGLYKIDMK